MTDDRVRTFVHTERGRAALPGLPGAAPRARARAAHRDRAARAGRGRRRASSPRSARATRSSSRRRTRSSRSGRSLAVPAHPPRPRAAPGARRGRLAARRRARRAGPARTACSAASGIEVSPRGVARLYRGLVDVFVLDRVDAAWAPRVAALGMRAVVTDTIMRTPARAARLAAVVLRALDALRAPRSDA